MSNNRAGLTMPGKILYFGVVLWALSVSTLRTIMPPNDWAETYWLHSYQFGFSKRALPGSTVRSLGLYGEPYEPERVILLVSYIVLASFLLCTVYLLWQLLRQSQWHESTLLFLLLFVTSPYYILLGHLNGYFDHIVGVLVIALLWLIAQRRWWVVIVIQIILMLTHENYLLVGFPIVMLFLVLLWRRKEMSSLYLVLVSSTPLLIFVLVLISSSLVDQLILRESMVGYLQTYSFIDGNYASLMPYLHTTSFISHFFQQYTRLSDRLFTFSYLKISMSFILTGIYYLFRHYQIRLLSYRGVFVLLVIVSPLLLHSIAWDTMRVWTFPMFHILLIAWVLRYFYEYKAQRLTLSEYLIFCCVLILHITIQPPLLGEAVEHFSLGIRWMLLGPLLLVGIAFSYVHKA